MIGKVVVGCDFHGVLKYLLIKNGAKRFGASIIGGNMAGDTAWVLAQEFNVASARRPNLTRSVAQHTLSLNPGLHLSNSDWGVVASCYLGEMGYGKYHQWVMVKHMDEKHEHVHIISCRIALNDGSVVSDANDRKRCHQAVAKAALSAGLIPIPSPDKTKPRAKLSRDEAEHARKLGISHPKLTISSRLDIALENSADFEQFKNTANKLGVAVWETRDEANCIVGISYRLIDSPDGFRASAWKGSSLGHGYSYQQVKKYLESKLMEIR